MKSSPLTVKKRTRVRFYFFIPFYFYLQIKVPKLWQP